MDTKYNKNCKICMNYINCVTKEPSPNCSCCKEKCIFKSDNCIKTGAT